MCRIVEFVKRSTGGQLGSYLQFLVLLLLLAGGFFVLMSIGGCDCDCDGSTSSEPTPVVGNKIRSAIEADKNWALPGERVSRKLSTSLETPPAPESIRMTWFPPNGSSNFTFDPPPDNPDGPGEFTWSSLDPGDEVEVSFDMPTTPPDCALTGCSVSEALTVEWGDQGEFNASAFSTEIRSTPPLSSAPSPPAAPRAAPPAQDHPQQVQAWQVESWLDPHGITLTTELCQEWADVLRGDSAFVAIRTPISSTAITKSYPLPVVFGGKYSNTLEIFRYSPFGPVFTASLNYRLDRLSFAANELPTVEGEAWLALGLSSEPITCPPGLEIPADGWSLVSRVLLDLSHQPGNCEGCSLLSYYCYEGQELPPFTTMLLSRWLGPEAGVTFYQDWGVTCAGPRFVSLHDEPPWELGGAGLKAITLTQPFTISFHHYISTDQSRDFDLSYSSTLPVGWGFYGGTGSEPDLGDPLTPPITVLSWADVWLVSNPVPTDTPAGDYTLILTATALTDPTPPSWTTSDLIWVGEWVPPPPPSCNELLAADVSGPNSGAAGTAYTFPATVIPPTATTPLTYTWMADGQTPAVHPLRGYTDTVSYTWDTDGLYWITVTAVNECGIVVSDAHSISIGETPPCQALGQVDIAGPGSAGVGAAVTFQASAGPPTATTPLTYTWTADGQTPAVHPLRGYTDTISYTWDTDGLYWITVTAVNECGIVVSDAHSISIGETPPCQALGQVDIAGPGSAGVGAAVTFQASAGPPTATTPLTYTWTADGQAPVVHSGGLNDSVEFTWTVTGTRVVTVTAENCGGSAVNTHTIVIWAGEQYTIYLPLVLKGS